MSVIIFTNTGQTAKCLIRFKSGENAFHVRLTDVGDVEVFDGGGTLRIITLEDGENADS